MKNNEEENTRGQQLIHKITVYLLSFIVVAAVIGTVFFFYNKYGENEQNATEMTQEAAKAALTEDEIEELYKAHRGEKEEPTQIEETSTEEPVSEETTEEENISKVDWEGLLAINPDVYAWIYVPGTSVDYPILQHATDNTYYLNYNIDGSYGYPGCIYTENLNAKDFSDPNTVIYGHNMKAGTMFAGLHNFRDEAFFKEHDRVYIYTPEKELEYTIFAAYVYDDRHLLYSFDFKNEEVYENYLNNILTMRDMTSLIREDVEVTKEDKIITLCTCMSKEPDKRLLVQAVLEP